MSMAEQMHQKPELDLDVAMNFLATLPKPWRLRACLPGKENLALVHDYDDKDKARVFIEAWWRDHDIFVEVDGNQVRVPGTINQKTGTLVTDEEESSEALVDAEA